MPLGRRLNLEILIDFSGLSLIFDFLIDSRLFELLPSIPMIVEYLNDYRDF